MRTYKVSSLRGESSGRALEDAVKAKVTGDIPVEVDLAKGEVRVGDDADPQIVSFAIEGAGYQVDSVIP